MPSIVIVSGCPGSGKTTLANALARADPMGLCIESDLFYGFPAHPIPPTDPDSDAQNQVIMRALARSTRAFAEGGYAVVLEGILGPWHMPLLLQELRDGPDVHYLVLRATEAEALHRVRERQGPGVSADVRQMVAAFADLGPYASHALDTMGVSAGEVHDIARRALDSGACRVGS